MNNGIKKTLSALVMTMVVLNVSVAGPFGKTMVNAETLSPEEIYKDAYLATRDAKEIKTQTSIDKAKAAIEKVGTTQYKDLMKELMDEISLLQKSLMKEAINLYYELQESFDINKYNRAKAILDNMRASSDKGMAAWGGSLKYQLNLIVYNSALKEMDDITYKLPNSLKSIHEKKKIKIAFWGDSITEGSDIKKSDSYTELFIEEIKKQLPDVTVEYKNFSLGGRNSFLAQSSQFKAKNPETNMMVNFWRPWAEQDKTWKQHVVEYQPDLLIVAFGMNDVTGNLSDYKFTNNITNIIDYVKLYSPNTDIALASTILPTRDKAVHKQSNEYTMQIARATREYAKINNIPLIDANRLWTIILKGIDEEMYIEKEAFGFDNVQNTVFYNGELQLSLTEYDSFDNSTDIIVRGKAEEGGIIFKLYKRGGENFISIYSMDNGKTNEYVDIGIVAAREDNTIKLDGATIIVNDESFVAYKHLREGFIDIDLAKEKIKNISLKYKVNIKVDPIYSEDYMLGYINWGSSGNGINHPTALAAKLTYFNGCKGLINGLTVLPEPVVPVLPEVPKVPEGAPAAQTAPTVPTEPPAASSAPPVTAPAKSAGAGAQ
jgi:lysophospholipase L1-like esterase